MSSAADSERLDSESSPDRVAPSSPTAPTPPKTVNLRRDPNRPRVPPFDYGNMGLTLREVLPRKHLPAELDPIWVDSPLNDIPLCWFGVPLRLTKIIKYAKEYDFDCPATTPHLAHVPGAVDEGKCWLNICTYFYQQTGINMRIRDVWDQRIPIIAFWSNRELVNIEDVKFRQVGMLLRDLEYEKEYYPRWFLDRAEAP